MPIAAKSVQIEENGPIFGAVSAVYATANSGHANLTPWPKGVSGNPSGRPKLARPPSVALAELNDTAGVDTDEIIAAFKAARGAKLCGADFKAIAMFKAESDVERRTHVTAFEAVTDRLEGKVPQSIAMKSEATLTIQIVPLYAMIDGKRPPELLEAEVVEEGEK
jgi:hypothetical protein